MKISEKWLREWVNPPIKTEELVMRLTMAGLEIDGVEIVKDNALLEVNVTPNRGDCLSIRGLARELSALTGMTNNVPSISPVKATIADVFSVTLDAASQCPYYIGRILKNVNNTGASPQWLCEKLQDCGLSSINPVVDVTNYVLLELGQPMHAFDFNKLSGKINVRLSKPGESITLLNGQNLNLKNETLLIADDKGPLALAGVMGGNESAVSTETRDIFLESAFFDPLALAGKARGYGLHTDSSQRFERGVDFDLQELAMERATALLLEIVGGEAGPIIKVVTKQLPHIEAINLRLSRVEQYLGLKLSMAEVQHLLEALGMEVTDTKTASLMVYPPSWRFDIRIEVDLLEEIARLYGYNKLPTHSPRANLDLISLSESQLSIDALKSRLLALGYTEVVTYSFVDPGLQASLQMGTTGAAIPVQNPISAEMGVMRHSLLPGLISTALYNLNRQQSRVRIFESGLTFTAIDQKYQQDEALGLLVCGARQPENWFNNPSQDVDFYDIKGSIEALFSLTGQLSTLNFKPSTHQALHPGQSADIYFESILIGWVGALHPALLVQLGFNQSVFVAQLAIKSLKKAKIPKFEEVSRFPEVRRDLAFIVGKGTPVELLCEKIKSVAGSYLTNLKVFDVYSGEGIDPQRKSVALGLTFRAKSRTLTDSEINENVGRVVSALKTHFQAELRS